MSSEVETRRRYLFPKPYADVVQKQRVTSGFVLLAAFVWFAHPTARSLLLGVPVSAAGLWLRAWAAGHLAKNQTLASSGPYAYVRNPLYLGTLFTAAGVVVSSRSIELAALAAAVFLLVYLPVIELEEQHLRKLFPDYDSYARRVPLLFPSFASNPGRHAFQWSLYRKNQEYKALAGYLAGLALLLWKATRVPS